MNVPIYVCTEAQANPDEITLSEEEVKFVKWLISTDEMTRALTKQGELLDWLNKLIGVVPGPVQLVQKWNMGTIKSWRLANKKLVELKRKVHCFRIEQEIAGETENRGFFEKLYEARGCQED